MATSIQVNQKSVAELLMSGKQHNFVVPEYQRPYAWSNDQCQTLWDDLIEYSTQEAETTYFLGTIVSFQNENHDQEIIDGQQRITTFFLLLRAIYSKLQKMEEIAEVKFLKGKIEPCIWQTHRLTGKPDFSAILIISKAISDNTNQKLTQILQFGVVEEPVDDYYSANFTLFHKLIDDYAKENPMLWYSLCNKILDECVFLPIECNNQETALTIFSTLNDRGLPLSDADIFKAKIYSHLDDDQKDVFINKWQELDASTERAGIAIQDLFYQYMFYLRARENDKNTTTPGLRKYFSRDKFTRLYEGELIGNLTKLSNLWDVINNHTKNESELWTKNINIAKLFDCLSSYNNEYWKYPVTIFYLENSGDEDFEEAFTRFLERFFSFICARYVLKPSINAVKSDIVALNATIISSKNPHIPVFDNSDEMKEQLKKPPHKFAIRMLLKVLAYQDLNQKELLPEKWDIEHILPKKWQTTSLYGKNRDEVKPYLELMGNFLPFERKLNVEAGNKYFGEKKKKYKTSQIAIAREMSLKLSDDWGPDDIVERNAQVAELILEQFKKWSLLDKNKDVGDTLSVEDQAKLEEFRKRGVI